MPIALQRLVYILYHVNTYISPLLLELEPLASGISVKVFGLSTLCDHVVRQVSCSFSVHEQWLHGHCGGGGDEIHGESGDGGKREVG